MKPFFMLAMLPLLSALGPVAYAGGDAAAGKAISSERCQACHGVDGNSSDPQYPRLAGQHADYLAHALRGYKSGARKNAIMAGFAAGLSEQDIKDVSAWFASQDGLTSPDLPNTVRR
jgi:cytochrome c553